MTRVVIALALVCVVHAEIQQTAGPYRVTLRLPPDGLFAREEMEIELRIEDTSRPDPLLGFGRVIRAAVEARVAMPEMPGMPAYHETAHPEGVPGDYGFHPTFAHGGDYVLRLTIAPPQGDAFPLEFPLKVSDQTSARAPRPPRFWLEVASSPKTPKVGEPADLRLVVRAREQPKQPYSSFEIAHEKQMHLVIVRTDLAQFAHEHPSMGPDGVFHLRRTFAEAGEYRLFADVAPSGAGSQVLMAKLNVSGKRIAAASIGEQRLSYKNAGVAIELKMPVLPLPAMTSMRVEAAGLPVDSLEDYLGAKGHLMLVHEDAVTFVHSHPISGLTFLLRLPKPGRYRAWLQFQRNGVVETADFVLQASESR